MADRYAVVGGSPATWSTSNTGMWSATSGGATGASVPVAGDDVYFDANTGTGTITLNYAPTIQSWDHTGYTGTFASTGSITITCTGNLIMSPTATYNNNGSQSLRFSAGLASRDVSIIGPRLFGSGNVNIDSGLVFGNFSLVHTDAALAASGFYVVNLAGGITINGALTLNGLEFRNVIRFRSNTFGTSRTVTMGASSSYSIQNFDIEYITFSGTGVPLIAGAGTGDIGYNSGITFPSPVTYYWIGNAGSWGTLSNFSLSSGGAAANVKPLPQDYVIFDDNSFSATGQAVTLNRSFLPDIDFTALSGSKIPTLALTAPSGQGNSFCRSLKLKSGMTTTGSATAWTMIGGRNCTFSQNGATLTSAISRLEFRNRDGFTCTLGSALTADTAIGGTGSNDGGFDSAGYAITVTGYQCSGTATRSIDLENSAITITGSGSNTWNFGTTTGLTLNVTGATLSFTDTSSAAKNFTTGGAAASYNIVNVSAGGTGPFTFNSNNKSFVTLNVTGPKTVIFAPSTTYTITNFNITSSRSQPVTFLSSTPGTQYTLSVASGTVGSRFMSILDCIGSGGATFVARESYGNNTTGWTIVPPRINLDYPQSSVALQFPGVSTSNVTSSAVTGVSSNGSYSLGGLAKFFRTNDTQIPFGFNANPVNPAVLLTSTEFLGGFTPLTGILTSTVRPQLGQWHHVFITYNSSGTRDCLYLNGYLVYTRSGSATAFTDGVVVLGRFAFSASSPQLGPQSRFCLYNRELSADEVMQLAKGYTTPTSGLRVQYNYTEGSGAALADVSGNGNNGTITGATWVVDRPVTARSAASNRQTLPATTIPGVAATGTITVTDYQYLEGKNSEATITITDYTLMAGGTLDLFGEVQVQEGVDFNAVTSNNQTAINLAAALLAAGAPAADVVGPAITIGVPGDNDGGAFTWDAGGVSPASGTFTGGFDTTQIDFNTGSAPFVNGTVDPSQIDPGGSNSTCATNIAAYINTNMGATVTANAVGAVITVTYDTAGVVGNSWSMGQSALNGGTISDGLDFSGATLSGGTDAVPGRSAASNRVQL